MPEATCEQEISAEEKEKIEKRVRKADINLRKTKKRIDRAEAEAWKKSRHRG